MRQVDLRLALRRDAGVGCVRAFADGGATRDSPRKAPEEDDFGGAVNA
jgi:hypothetical protein